MLTSGHDKIRISVMILNFGHAFQRSDGFEVFRHASQRSDGLKFGHTSRGPMELDFGRASQRFNGLILDMLPRDPMV